MDFQNIFAYPTTISYRSGRAFRADRGAKSKRPAGVVIKVCPYVKGRAGFLRRREARSRGQGLQRSVAPLPVKTVELSPLQSEPRGAVNK